MFEFNKQYGHLKKYGLIVHGVGNLIGDSNVISISIPFLFNRTKLPKTFMGLDVRIGITENEMPIEFQNVDKNKEYIWAYQNLKTMLTVTLTLFARLSKNLK